MKPLNDNDHKAAEHAAWEADLRRRIAAGEPCPHPGATDIVTLLGDEYSKQSDVRTHDGRAFHASEGTCGFCGVRVVTVSIYDPNQPWNVINGHGGTDRHTAWTAWHRP